ncbi:atma protein [Diplodia corticola]|uniref:Atma protein n=1 Tax=Diplodia corticola TaxID=236234 RepID=A0A1J9RPR2_9PEZI|nr:atma protein [Diplodia corticola]OJD29549.1 atma protein [Diplodia corticola]
MVNLNFSTVVLLPALLAAGATTTMVFSTNNATFANITAIIDDTTITTMPGTDGLPLTREWTGIAPLDRQFTVLLIFFWQLLDGRHPAATLQAAHFFGQMGAYWTLMQLEAKRQGNKHRIIAYTTLIGLLYQNISVAITIPLWCLLHLLALPSRTNSSALTASLSFSPTEARILPWAMTLGYILPTAAMSLPSPALVPALTQQTLVSAWQVFPLWIHLSTAAILRPFFSTTTPTTSTTPTTTSTPHLFAFLLATIPHAATLSLSLSTLLFPALFRPSLAASLHPAAVFLPKYSPASPSSASSASAAAIPLEEGVHRFMQWDECVSGAAAVVWAATLYVRDTRIKGNNGGGEGGIVRWGWLGVAARAVGWSVVGGPAAAAVALVWGRDEVCLVGGNKKM